MGLISRLVMVRRISYLQKTTERRDREGESGKVRETLCSLRRSSEMQKMVFWMDYRTH